jgi:hypothetical protein
MGFWDAATHMSKVEWRGRMQALDARIPRRKW